MHDWQTQGEHYHSLITRVRKHLEDQNADDPRIFKRDIFAVRIARNASTGQLIIKNMDMAEFGSELDRVTVWSVTTEDGRVKIVETPHSLAEKVLKSPDLSLPPLRAVVDTPFFTKDGELVIEPGYNAASGVYYDPPRDGLNIPDVPLEPTKEDLVKAVGLIREIYCDFPFHDGDSDPKGEASRTNTVARDLTSFVRETVTCVPFFATSKPGHDVGGTLLAKVGSIITTGGEPSIETVKENSREWQVSLHAHALAGTRRILIDNVPRDYVIDDPNFAASATAARLSGRVLGESTIGGGDVRWVFEFTGVNLKFSQENARRTIMIRLDAQMTTPGERKNFAHPDLLEWAAENRGSLVWAYLVLVRHWQACGKPTYKGKPLSSFESWSNVIGGILECAGFKKFNENRDLLDSEDERGMKEFVAAWHEAFGVKEVQCGVLEPHATPCKGAPHTLADLYFSLTDTGYIGVSRKPKDSDTLGQRLGNKLSEYVGSYYRIGGADFRIVKTLKNKGKFYCLEQMPLRS